MTIAYRVRDGLYVNLTNQCPCRCSFCIRQNGAGAYGSDSLWLEHDPSYDEIVSAITSADPSHASELVFCGYGEPTERLDILIKTARHFKSLYPSLPVRVNTNGLSDLINGRSTAADFAGAVDAVSISLNAPTAEAYMQLCHPKFGIGSYEAMLSFARDIRAHVPSVTMTVVATENFSDAQHATCKAICDRLGVSLRVRTLIK